ncbi:MAG: TonB family protein [Bacteroidia bacterium]|nr:TonB family protein [Bacteroidia bacterium]
MYKEREREERAIQRRSAVLTALFSLMLGILAAWWVIKRGISPPEDEPQYVVVGRIDFGNLREGGMKINNQKPPTEKPKQAEPARVKTPVVKKSPPKAEKVVTQKAESKVKTTEKPVAKPEAKPGPKPADKPAPKPAAEAGGGANHGQSDRQVGDRGTPKAPFVDPQGLFTFGTGDGEGLNGRELLSYTRPKYDAQEEGKMTFQITISPDGRVVAVKAVNYGGQRHLKEATEAALRKWRFSPVETGQNQTVKVTFTFKLK